MASDNLHLYYYYLFVFFFFLFFALKKTHFNSLSFSTLFVLCCFCMSFFSTHNQIYGKFHIIFLGSYEFLLHVFDNLSNTIWINSYRIFQIWDMGNFNSFAFKCPELHRNLNPIGKLHIYTYLSFI